MSASLNGNWSNLNVQRGGLLEYAEVDSPLQLHFEFNPKDLSRTRTVTIKTGGAPGTRGGYDFRSKAEARRAAQSVSVNTETFSITVLLDATDRMNAGDATASVYGVEPELDTLRSMIEPKAQGADGARVLAALGQGDQSACSSAQYASVLLFYWGVQVLPVFLLEARITIKEFLPDLTPYRAEAVLKMQIIESRNDFYEAELKRMQTSADRHIGSGQGYTVGWVD